MAYQGWIPDAYFDEIVPEPKGHPTQWVGRLDDGAAALLDFYAEKGEARLVDGETVRFREHRDYGTATLTVTPDGAWTVDRPMPAEANGVWCGEAEAQGDTIAALVANWKEAADDGMASSFEDSGPVTITYGWWSDPIPFRFDAGNNSFVQVAS